MSNVSSHNPAGVRRYCVAIGLAAVASVLMLGTSFSINNGPAAGASAAELATFAQEHFRPVALAAWLQAVGTLLAVTSALGIVHLAGAHSRLAGSMTLLGGAVLMTVSLSEVVIYLSALAPSPENIGLISVDIGHAIQHLYFIVAAPALFLPLGWVILSSAALPKYLGYLAIALAGVFLVVGATSIYRVALPPAETSLGAIQAVWWMTAGVTLIVRSREIAQEGMARIPARSIVHSASQ